MFYRYPYYDFINTQKLEYAFKMLIFPTLYHTHPEVGVKMEIFKYQAGSVFYITPAGVLTVRW